MRFRRPLGRPPHPDVLTPAEWRILEHLRAGRPNQEIAIRLGVSVNTVRTHVSSMLAKLELTHRHELAAWRGEPAGQRGVAPKRFRAGLMAWTRWSIVGQTASVALVAGLAIGTAFLLISAGRVGGWTEPGATQLKATPTVAVTTVVEMTPAAPDPAASSRAAADLLATLDVQGIAVLPTGDTVICADANGAAGVEYEGDAHLILWEYMDRAALDAEWHVHDGGFSAHHRIFACNRPPARIFHRDNLILWTSADFTTSPKSYEAGYALLNLGGMPAPTDIHQFPIGVPAPGEPIGGEDLLGALADRGLTYLPYEQPACPYPDEAGVGGSQAVVQFFEGPLPSEGPNAGFQVLVFPDVAALDAEWDLGEDGPLGAAGVHAPSNVECTSSGRIYRQENVLIIGTGPSWDPTSATVTALIEVLRSISQ